MKNKIKVVIVAIILAIITLALLSALGRTYTVKVPLKSVENLDEVNVVLEQDDNYLEIVDTNLKDNELSVKLHSKKSGKAHFNVLDENNEDIFLDVLYVNDLGVITQNGYFGYSNGSIVIPIFTSVFIAYSLYILINLYRKSMKENMYKYKDISRLGLIIFLSFYLILIKREGFSIRNLLGFILGIFFCVMTVFPESIKDLLMKLNLLNLYNENAVEMYIVLFLQTAVAVIVTYLEYILIATIVHGVKAAKHIPTLDKDYIIILGCQIKKDGTLTPLLKSRADRAIEFAKLQKEKTGKDIVFVPSGGKGTDETIAEGEAIKNYLLEQGINEEQILLENKSKNTYENIKFSKELIDSKNPDAKIAFSTTNYHVYRAGAIAQEQGINVEGIGVKTKTYFWINAFIREFKR